MSEQGVIRHHPVEAGKKGEGLAEKDLLRELELLEGPRDGDQEFGCPDQWFWKAELDCDEDVISGLMLGLSALSGLRILKTDMLADWGSANAAGFALMLSRMPALETLGDIFQIRSATWDKLCTHLGPTGHPSLRELISLRYSEPQPADLESMARAMSMFPQLQRLDLQLANMNDLDVGDQMSRLAHLLASLRTHPTLRELVFDDFDITLGIDVNDWKTMPKNKRRVWGCGRRWRSPQRLWRALRPLWSCLHITVLGRCALGPPRVR